MSSFYSDMIYEKIVEAGNEAVFIATDFLDIADYETARKALNRLDSYGKIKKICRGVYYNPKFSELLGEYEAPSPHMSLLPWLVNLIGILLLQEIRH